MSASRELSLRKEILVAQSALYRAQLRYEVVALRSRASRASTWIERGMVLISVVRTVLVVVSLFRK